jgi:hypothetical protein
MSESTSPDDKKVYLMIGVFLMLVTIGFILFLPDMTTRRWVGVILLGVIGLGLTVAGSPDPRDREDRRH